jgi:hypothetical protein
MLDIIPWKQNIWSSLDGMSNFIICTIANFSVMVTISKENIYLSRFMQMSNRLNFGIGNSFFKLPCGGKGFFLWHVIWKRKSGNIAQRKLVHHRIWYNGLFSLNNPLEVGNTNWLFGEDNSIWRNTTVHPWNFIIIGIYDLIIYQGRNLSGLLEFSVGGLSALDFFGICGMCVPTPPLEVQLSYLIYDLGTYQGTKLSG